jgi:acid phosphatase family membrane protein YuiD
MDFTSLSACSMVVALFAQLDIDSGLSVSFLVVAALAAMIVLGAGTLRRRSPAHIEPEHSTVSVVD